ncbi:dihydropteroate synthase, partial [bacterium]|nr:dihydropteroate synthase [bacterium]
MAKLPLPLIFRRRVEIAEEGALALDVGGESTRPGSLPVPLDEERRRVLPLLEELERRRFPLPISVDTRKAALASDALERGAKVVNDVSALGDEEMAPLVARRGAFLILMHMQGTPETMQRDPRYASVVLEVADFLRERRERALEAGVARERVLVDQGPGRARRRRPRSGSRRGRARCAARQDARRAPDRRGSRRARGGARLAPDLSAADLARTRGRVHNRGMRGYVPGRIAVALLSLPLLLSGCSCLHTSDRITDEEIKARGEWTDEDRAARRILDDLGGAERPVRLPTVERKLTTIGLEEGGIAIGAVGTLLGLNYDKKYYYSEKEKAYVLLVRGRAPVVVPDSGDGQKASPEQERRAAREADLALRLGERIGPPIELPKPEQPDLVT